MSDTDQGRIRREVKPEGNSSYFKFNLYCLNFAFRPTTCNVLTTSFSTSSIGRAHFHYVPANDMRESRNELLFHSNDKSASQNGIGLAHSHHYPAYNICQYAIFCLIQTISPFLGYCHDIILGFTVYMSSPASMHAAFDPWSNPY